MEQLPNLQNPTPEIEWVYFKELHEFLRQSSAETERLMKESRANFDREMKESRANFDHEMEKSRADFDRRMKKMEEQMGGWGNNFGAFAEEYFLNSFENHKQNFFGEKFDEIENNLKPKKKKNIADEYDIVMTNGSSVAIVETKFKAHTKDVDKVKNKAVTYRILCPEYKDYKIYLGLASMSFYPEVEKACIAEGIAVIKQVGENIVINDAHLKVF